MTTEKQIYVLLVKYFYEKYAIYSWRYRQKVWMGLIRLCCVNMF